MILQEEYANALEVENPYKANYLRGKLSILKEIIEKIQKEEVEENVNSERYIIQHKNRKT